MQHIKEYKEFTNVFLKSGDILRTTLTVEGVVGLLNDKDFVVIDGV